MRIVCFSTYFYPYVSGAMQYPYILLKYLARKNNKIDVFTIKYKKALSTEEFIEGIAIHRVNPLINISKGFFTPFLPFQIFHKLIKADKIIINQPSFEGIFVAILSFFFRKPIISIYNCEVDLGKDIISRLIVYFLNTSVHIQLLLSNKIVTNTEDYAKERLILKRFISKIIYIYPPIKPYLINRSKFRNLIKIKKEKMWIGFCGRISREKGVEYLIDACKHIRGISDYEVVFAGPFGKEVIGEDKYLNKLIIKLKENRVQYRFLGKLNYGDLWAFYKAIDVLVLPSINRTESFGMVQVESMISGKPVVVSDLPGVRIPIKKTDMGILVKPKNSKEIAQALEKIISNYDEYANKEKISRAKQVFNIKNFYKQWAEIL